MTAINEDLARRNQENFSFRDYQEGSATAEYESTVADVSAQVEQAKKRVSDEGKERLDSYLVAFRARLADWYNRRNASGAGHVSVMIAGPSGYNTKQHDKWVAREGKLFEEYNQIMDVRASISKIIAGDRRISSDADDALQQLRDKLEAAEAEHARYKERNKTARKAGKDPLPAYVLTNSNGRMRQIKQRIKDLERRAEDTTTEREIGGVTMTDNVEENRLQLVFNGKPSEETRARLKSNGFRWAPSVGAWQRQRSRRAAYVAEAILNQKEEEK